MLIATLRHEKTCNNIYVFTQIVEKNKKYKQQSPVASVAAYIHCNLLILSCQT